MNDHLEWFEDSAASQVGGVGLLGRVDIRGALGREAVGSKVGVPVVIVNRGGTRGDDLATMRLEIGCAEATTALARSTPTELARA